jgi:hypothetical protein
VVNQRGQLKVLSVLTAHLTSQFYKRSTEEDDESFEAFKYLPPWKEVAESMLAVFEFDA